MKREPLRLLARCVLITASLSALLFLAAGTTHMASIRNYLAILSALLLITMLTVDPRLAQERAHPRNTGIDGGLRFAAGFFFLLTLTVAAFSVGRLPPGFNVPTSLRDAALVAFALSGSLQTWAMITNPFFSPVVRLQTERGHHVIADGPYRLVRHPGYFAMSISVTASALAIGSWVALVPAVGFVLLIRRRAQLEDEFLKNNLPGYADYARRVLARLAPHKMKEMRDLIAQLSGNRHKQRDGAPSRHQVPESSSDPPRRAGRASSRSSQHTTAVLPLFVRESLREERR
jgi:protein-S-isoprenylcysteine O-methyltransferase Ste14